MGMRYFYLFERPKRPKILKANKRADFELKKTGRSKFFECPIFKISVLGVLSRTQFFLNRTQ